jgi:predicted alpha/beta-fold hydrolase
LRNRHAQPIWGPLARRGRMPYRRERVATSDGDFVDLDWLVAPAVPGAPLLLLLHGLEGDNRSHYVRGMLQLARDAGWRALVLNFRSCSGEPNRLPRFYHSGDTEDFDHVVRLLLEREPSLRLAAVGVSLGGNVLLKWLGERGDDAPAALRAAVAISTPYDIEACARVLDQGFAKWTYTASFMRSFKRKVREKARAFPGFVDVAAVMRAATFAAYDRVVTAPLHGFADELDYWRRSSCKAYLALVRRPVLLISAADDPFVPPSALPDPATLPPNVVAEFTPRGGHVGFVEGPPWRPRAWAERRAIGFVRDVLADDVC